MHGCHSSMLEPLYRYRKSRVRIPLLHELGRSLSLEFFYPQISLKLIWAYFCSGNCLVWVMNKFNLRMRRRFLKHLTLKISAFQEFWAPYSGDWNSPNLPPGSASVYINIIILPHFLVCWCAGGPLHLLVSDSRALPLGIPAVQGDTRERRSCAAAHHAWLAAWESHPYVTWNLRIHFTSRPHPSHLRERQEETWWNWPPSLQHKLDYSGLTIQLRGEKDSVYTLE